MLPRSQVGPAPVTRQPRSTGMTPQTGTADTAATSADGWPHGLEALARADQLIVEQKMEMLEGFTAFETTNKYVVKTITGEEMYFAVEESICCARCCCGRGRPFRMSIVDDRQREVLSFQRPLRCLGCACCPDSWGCEQQLVVLAGGLPLGTVHEEWQLTRASLTVRDADGSVRLRISGPSCLCSCCSDIDFRVMSANGEHQVGTITKQCAGMAKEVFEDGKTFSVTFPHDADAGTKATLLAAAFLIGYMYFERDSSGGDT